MNNLKKNIPLLISIVILVLLWHFVTVYQYIDKLFLPSFKDIIKSFFYLFTEKHFISDISISVFRVWISFILSFIVAVPMAFWMSESKLANNILSPYIDFIRYLPVPTLIPLTILFFGIDEASKIALLFIGTFFPFILMIIDDIKNIPKEYINLSYTLNLSRFEKFKVKFKAILPELYDNSRISIGIAWTYLVIAELVASQKGIGFMIKEAHRFANTANVYAGIITMGLIGFSTDYILKKLYPKFFKYKVINQKKSIND